MPATQRWRQLRLDDIDWWFLGAVLALVLLGTVAVFGAGSFQADERGVDFYLIRHLQRLAIGAFFAVGLAWFDHVRLHRPWLVWSALGTGLVLTAVPVVMRGMTIDRWVELPGLGQFQPIELAKLSLVLFLAYRLSASTFDRPLTGRHLAITVATGPLAIMVLLVLQPNFGNVIVMALVTGAVLLVAGMSWRWFAAAVPLAAGVGAIGYTAVPKLQTRLDQWWQGWHGLGTGPNEPAFGYQVHQSLLGMGAGGWHGLGPGNSHNKFAFLPENHTDFALSFLGEELGLFGTVTVVLALSLIAWRSLVIARRAPTRFGRLLAAGLGIMIFIYGAANVAMVTAVTPVMGVPLPFVSYGGSALVTNLAAVGLILNVDRQGRGRRRTSS